MTDSADGGLFRCAHCKREFKHHESLRLHTMKPVALCMQRANERHCTGCHVTIWDTSLEKHHLNCGAYLRTTATPVFTEQAGRLIELQARYDMIVQERDALLEEKRTTQPSGERQTEQKDTSGNVVDNITVNQFYLDGSMIW